MIYTPLTKKALKISFNAHKDQVDKSGMPYVYHPFHLAESADAIVEHGTAYITYAGGNE